VDRAAFDALLQPHWKVLEGFVRRMVGHPEDSRDLVQDTLLAAFEHIDDFRGEAQFRTWLLAIASRRCIDHLRKKKRWSWDAQETVRKKLYQELGADGVRQHLLSTEFRFDAREHIAFCFSCVGRSLEPLDQAALMLSEVFELGDREAAKALELSEPVLRHHLADARQQMQERFEGLCGLVNKAGVCWQCKGLRQQTTERGPELPDLQVSDADEKRRLRLKVVQDGEINEGVMQSFHDTLWRALETL
jgi:RNA polymerase sigma-70 factor (ECF subfamily)